MYETTGVLAPVVQAYLNGDAMTPPQISTMRAYLRQWIQSPVWGDDPAVEKLRSELYTLLTSRDLKLWLKAAWVLGIDPL